MQAKASPALVESAGLADGSIFDGEGEDQEAASAKDGKDKEGEGREQQQQLGSAGATLEISGTTLTPECAVQANTSCTNEGGAEPQQQQGHRRSSRQAERSTGARAAAGAAAPAAEGSPAAVQQQMNPAVREQLLKLQTLMTASGVSPGVVARVLSGKPVSNCCRDRAGKRLMPQ
jgi:hypothetical protein